jgi:hypothetical protein
MLISRQIGQYPVKLRKTSLRSFLHSGFDGCESTASTTDQSEMGVLIGNVNETFQPPAR